MPGTGWSNAEFRTYQYSDESLESDSLVETADSRKRRGKEDAPPTREEQEQLFKEGMQSWGDQGLQVPTRMDDKVNSRR